MAMILVQKFHSIHEIDTEFVQNLESLLQEEIMSFDILIERHDLAPATDVFTYFLFFGPTQNAPIGFAQLCLRSIPTEGLIPWHRKLKFWSKDYLHWKEAIWKVGDGNFGFVVSDPRFSRSIKEKMQELIKEQEARPEVMAQHLFCLKGMQEFHSSWSTENRWSRDSFILEPLMKSYKTYPEYLGNLPKEVAGIVKEAWKKLHKESKVELGDYPNLSELPVEINLDESVKARFKKHQAQILTFEKDKKILGCLSVFKGKGGNVFIEPYPFEPEGDSLVHDDLYIQYAILKFHEMPDARKCHIMKHGTKLLFEEKEDLKFFQEQGFQFRTVTQHFCSKIPNFTNPT
jgi:hypothetical protein